MNRRRAKKAAVKWYAEQGLARETGARLTGRERVWIQEHRRALLLFAPFGDVERAMRELARVFERLTCTVQVACERLGELFKVLPVADLEELAEIETLAEAAFDQGVEHGFLLGGAPAGGEIPCAS